MKRVNQSLCVALLGLTMVGCSVEPEPKPAPLVAQEFRSENLGEGDFYALPFPENERLKISESAGIEWFPNPGTLTILDTYKDVFTKHFNGFGLNSAIYLRFENPVSPESLPESPLETIKEGASVQLLNIDQSSPDYSFPVPVTLHYQEYTGRYIDAETLVALPLPGHPLRENTTYALVVRNTVHSRDHELFAQSSSLRDRLRKPDAAGLPGVVNLDEIIAVAVFTTQDATSRFFRVADYVRSTPGLSSWESRSGPVTWRYFSDDTNCYEYQGRVSLPNFQHGEIPYRTTGGDFEYANDGQPIVAQTDSVRYLLRLPETYEADKGMPYVIYSHGTGGDYTSVRGITQQMCKRGIASIGVDQPLHGDRLPSGEPSLWTFNLFNPVAMVHNFLQGGVESIALATLMEKLVIPAHESPYGVEVRMNPDAQMFMGHSQGALSGAPTLAADGHRFAGAVFSGSSGGLALALLLKVEPVNFPILMELGLGTVGEFDVFHPALNLFQMFGEPADPLNYARYILSEARSGQEQDWRPLHFFQTEGIEDKYTVPAQSEALSAALNIDWAGPRLQKVEALEWRSENGPLPLPIQGNLEYQGKQYTSVMHQYPLGHFSVFDDPDAWEHFAHFLQQVSQGQIPTIE